MVTVEVLQIIDSHGTSAAHTLSRKQEILLILLTPCPFPLVFLSEINLLGKRDLQLQDNKRRRVD